VIVMAGSATVVEELTPAEAALVSRVSVRDVHRVIDERILPEGFFDSAGGRTFSGRACVFISFYFRAAGRLTAEERVRAIGMASGVAGDRVVHDGFLTIDFAPFWKDVEDGLARLQAAREMVMSDAEILSGTPVVKGTRVPVYHVAASVAAGVPVERILLAYPSLTAEQVELACLYAEANPLRGRPRLRDSLPENAVVLTRRRKQRIPATA
jgi:uncharacterized protein (DUF433 family)